MGTVPGTVCESWSGQCQCLEGVGGKKCGECARGFKGIPPHCEPCGECFDSWDKTISTLIAETTRVLAKVADIQEKGVAGAYDSQFAQIENYLNNAKALLEDDGQVMALESFMKDIESNAKDGNTRLVDIYQAFNDIHNTHDFQKSELHKLNSNIDSFQSELKRLNMQLDQVEGKDPKILWQRITDAGHNATRYEILAKVINCRQ
jgi:laminin beta 1